MYTPTEEEYDRRRRTHLPCRSWYPVCIQAKRKNTGDTQFGRQERSISAISVDNMRTDRGMNHDKKPKRQCTTARAKAQGQ